MTGERAAAYPSRLRAWSMIAVLSVAAMVSVIDRSLLNFVVDPIKADVGLTDVQMSLLQGLAFGLFYATLGIPLGLAADRYSRRRLIIVGMTLWSFATIGGGLAQSFGWMFLSRILVGLGEAALSPAAISLISDMFPPDKRGRPISIFLMGQGLAGGLSISVASLMLHAARSGLFAGVPGMAGLAPWRAIFVCFGAAGLVVAALMAMTREPARAAQRQGANIGRQALGSIAYLGRNATVFVPFYLGFALYFAAVYGAGAWAPTMLLRGFGATIGQLGQWLGPLSLVFGCLGPLVGGLLADRQARRGTPRAKLVILMLAPLAALPSALAVFAPGLAPAILLVAAMGAVTALVGTVTMAALQDLVPPHMRGVAVALTGLGNTIIGAASGPFVIAELTERVYRDPAHVGYSIASLAVPAVLLGAGLYGLSFLALRRQSRTGGEVARLIAAQGAAGL